MELRPVEGAAKERDRSDRRPSDDDKRFRPVSYGGRGLRVRAGFSLFELLSVVAILVLMAALLYSGLSGFSSSAGRRGAANILMNTLEHARVAALESGQTVYVGFADGDFPVEEMRYTSFLVFRETSDEERTVGAGNYVVLKKWTKLPANVAFKRVASSLVPESGGQTFPGLSDALAAGQRDETFPSLAFNGSGAVDGGSNPLQLFLYEGYYANKQDIQTRKGGSLFEKISLSRYTGRAQLDVTATGIQ
ncbi:MAG TPA: prepilin-type N-terminal cleavage/methylation domain-containing protein [Terrimicrobiaceae bacterium]